MASAYARDWIRAFVLAEVLSICFVIMFMNCHIALFDELFLALGFNIEPGWPIAQLAQMFYFHTNVSFDAVWGGGSGGTPWSLLWSSLPYPREWFLLVGGCLGVALLFFGLAITLAAARVRRSWRQEPAPRQMSELKHSLTRPRFAVPFLRRLLSRSLDRNPIGWLQHYSWSNRITKWGWLGVIMAIESVLIADLWDFAELQNWVLLLLLVGVAFTASASFRKERESGALELLLVCPLSVAQIIGGRVRGIWMQFLPSGALLILCLFVGAEIERHRSDALTWAALAVPFFIALPMVGLYFSTYRIHFLIAWLLTVLLGTVLPWFLMLCVMLVFEIDYFVYGLILLELALGALFWRLLYLRLETRRFAFAQA